jgi:uncharacterized protein YgiM (DUF1202 family)
MMWRRGFIPFFAVLLLCISALPAAAQPGVTWNAEYYNNAFLNGPAVLARQEGAISYDWGSGSPGPNVVADNFSARWGADPFFTAGTYRFYALADDRIRIYIDFQPSPIIDTFGVPRVGQTISADVALSQGQHHIQVDYVENGGNAYVYMTWANLATNPTGPNFPVPGNPGGIPASGPWTAQYYANPNLAGTPTLIQSEVTPTHNWGTGSPIASLPADNFSVRWTSTQYIPAGTYQLSVLADDGVRVVIDGISYINEWHNATGTTYRANVSLAAGEHSFLVEYFEVGGVAFLTYDIAPLSSIVPTNPPPPVNNPPPVNTGAYGTVTNAYRLNVRQTPDPINGQVLTKINRNETYPVVGRNANRSWWQINVNGTIGWVNARYLSVTNAQNVPVTSQGGGISNPPPVVVPTNPPPVTGVTCAAAPYPRLQIGRLGRVTPGLPNNLRSGPSPSSPLIGQIPSGGVFSVISGPQCAGGYYWWQVNYNGVTGWTPEGGAGQYWVEPA